MLKLSPVLLCCAAVVVGFIAAGEPHADPGDGQGLVPNIALERIEIVKDGAYDYYTHDPRGRILYARYRMQF